MIVLFRCFSLRIVTQPIKGRRTSSHPASSSSFVPRTSCAGLAGPRLRDSPVPLRALPARTPCERYLKTKPVLQAGGRFAATAPAPSSAAAQQRHRRCGTCTAPRSPSGKFYQSNHAAELVCDDSLLVLPGARLRDSPPAAALARGSVTLTSHEHLDSPTTPGEESLTVFLCMTVDLTACLRT